MTTGKRAAIDSPRAPENGPTPARGREPATRVLAPEALAELRQNMTEQRIRRAAMGSHTDKTTVGAHAVPCKAAKALRANGSANVTTIAMPIRRAVGNRGQLPVPRTDQSKSECAGRRVSIAPARASASSGVSEPGSGSRRIRPPRRAAVIALGALGLSAVIVAATAIHLLAAPDTATSPQSAPRSRASGRASPQPPAGRRTEAAANTDGDLAQNAPGPRPIATTRPTHGSSEDNRRPAVVLATPRAAADLLIAGRHRQALVMYKRLAEQQPEQPVYGAIARILAQKTEQACGLNRRVEEQTCTRPK